MAVAASQGFAFHHAEQGSSTLTLWLGEGPSRLPGFATHQLGVAGELQEGLHPQKVLKESLRACSVGIVLLYNQHVETSWLLHFGMKKQPPGMKREKKHLSALCA